RVEREGHKKAVDLLFGDLWGYAPAPESTGPVRFEKRYGHFIDGEFVAGERWFPSVNPATEEPLAEFAEADEAMVDRAVQSARKAYDKYWKKMKGSERAKYIFR